MFKVINSKESNQKLLIQYDLEFTQTRGAHGLVSLIGQGGNDQAILNFYPDLYFGQTMVALLKEILGLRKDPPRLKITNTWFLPEEMRGFTLKLNITKSEII